jgi:hypothetical protein
MLMQPHQCIIIYTENKTNYETLEVGTLLAK